MRWPRSRTVRTGADAGAPARRASLRQRRAGALAVLGRHGAAAAFAAGLTVIAIVLVVVLSQDGLRRAGYNFTPARADLGLLAPGATGCQPESFSVGTR